jgi:hypothetical protein
MRWGVIVLDNGAELTAKTKKAPTVRTVGA